jgi:hypothetical protein
MGHELTAKIEHGFLTGPLHKVRLAEIENESADDYNEIRERKL